VKLLRGLNHTKEHPEDGERVGAIWSADGESFFLSSRIFGAFLSLKANTINTNLRDHGFAIAANGESTNAELANLPECRHWKRRCHPGMRMMTRIEEAEKMATKVNHQRVVTRPASIPDWIPEKI
jgi:hypothetical protein